jgi:hypothetical protein
MNKNKVQVVAATYQVNNDHVDDREYRISASVRQSAAGQMEVIENGVISALNGHSVATFRRYMGGGLTVEFDATCPDQTATLDAINGFIADCEEGGVEA